MEVDAFVELSCVHQEFQLTALIQELTPANAELEYMWYDTSGNLIYDSNPLITQADGCYDLFINAVIPEGQCVFFIDRFCFDKAEYHPTPPVTNGDTLICSSGFISFCITPDSLAGGSLSYEWTAPQEVLVFQDGSECVEMQFAQATGGSVCVTAINECGQSEPTCFDVSVMEAPVADFTIHSETCIDSTVTISFAGSAGIQAEYQWDFDGGHVYSGSGAGPYHISWSTEGSKLIGLSVIVPDCDISQSSKVIEVLRLDAPVMECHPAVNGASFQWVPDVLASEQNVRILTGHQGTQNGNTYEIIHLMPSDTVLMEIISQAHDVCPERRDTFFCHAKDCPPIEIELEPIEQGNLHPNIDPVKLEVAMTGTFETGIWLGPGIIDAKHGIFDPAMAGEGAHVIVYKYEKDDCDYTTGMLIQVNAASALDVNASDSVKSTEVLSITTERNVRSATVYIPNVFSPNGDGHNDYFSISGDAALIGIISMQIFDSRGKRIFEVKDVTPGVEEEGWNGTFQNEFVEPGVYVFVAELKYIDAVDIVSGNITVIR